eukprot:15352921-Ditylum_brightwellii.AAC.1
MKNKQATQSLTQELPEHAQEDSPVLTAYHWKGVYKEIQECKEFILNHEKAAVTSRIVQQGKLLMAQSSANKSISINKTPQIEYFEELESEKDTDGVNTEANGKFNHIGSEE